MTSKWTQGLAGRLALLFTWVLLALDSRADSGNRERAAETDKRPIILSSIRPLFLLSRELLGDGFKHQLLMNARQSPHHHALRPGELRALAAADHVLWIGPQLEAFLPRTLSRLGVEHSSLIELLQKERPSELLGDPVDPHLWVSLNTMQAVADLWIEKLARQYPDRAPELRQRLQALKQRWASLDLPPPPNKVRLLTWHNAFSYLSRDVGRPIHSLTGYSGEANPGLKTFGHWAEKVVEEVTCMLEEPQYHHHSMQGHLQERADYSVILDPLADSAEDYTSAYIGWRTALAQCVQARTSTDANHAH